MSAEYRPANELVEALRDAVASVDAEHPRVVVSDGDDLERIARQHAEAVLCHYAHVNALVPPDGLGGELFDAAVDELAFQMRGHIASLTARW